MGTFQDVDHPRSALDTLRERIGVLDLPAIEARILLRVALEPEGFTRAASSVLAERLEMQRSDVDSAVVGLVSRGYLVKDGDQMDAPLVANFREFEIDASQIMELQARPPAYRGLGRPDSTLARSSLKEFFEDEGSFAKADIVLFWGAPLRLDDLDNLGIKEKARMPPGLGAHAQTAGAVGEACGEFIRETGESISHPDYRRVGFEWDELLELAKDPQRRVIFVGGARPEYLPLAHAVLNAGAASTLITDVEFGRSLLEPTRVEVGVSKVRT